MSPARTLQRRVAPDENGRRLDDLVASRLREVSPRPVSNAAARRAIMAGLVSLDGRPVRRPGLPVRAGAALAMRVDLDALAPPEPRPVALGAADILYEDSDLLIVVKPAGISTHRGADPGRMDLVAVVRAYLAARAGARGAPYLGVHQRLDRETSGAILFARSERANAPLAAAFAAGAVRKHYDAVVEAGTIGRAGLSRGSRHRLTQRLAMTGTGRRARMAPDERGQPAETLVRIVERLGPAWLVDAEPRTGRRHQIRAHLAAEGHPIVGDVRYGASSRWPFPVPRLLLHARSLELPHPIARQMIRVNAPWPDDFRAAVEQFRRLGGRPREVRRGDGFRRRAARSRR